jgi:hypothetical protein
MEDLTPHQNEALGSLRSAVVDLFGSDAQFTYTRESTNTIATLTLDEAIMICGRHIATEGHESVMATLERMHDTARSLESKNPDLYERSKKMGHQVLKRYQ